MKFEIERRANLSYRVFCKEYLFANKPVIVTDVMREWKALTRWTPEFFQKEFGAMKITFDGEPNASGGYQDGRSTVEYQMAQYIDRVLQSSNENPAPYFRNRVLYDLFPSLKQDIEPLPEYFQPNWLSDRYMVKRVGEVLNRGAAIELYIGGTGGSFPVLHYDGSGTHAFLMQIYGRKQYVVYPPSQEPFLYPSPKRENVSLLNSVETPDLERFPLFAKAVPTVFVLEPGELLFVPSHWWHTAKMLSSSITVSANVLNQSNWHELVRFVAMRRANPLASLASRAYLAVAGARRSWRDRAWRKRARGLSVS
jgi:histone arginine demethylase JMJD6